MSKSKKLTKEEELLLQDFGRNVSTKSSVLFYCNAFIVSAVPLCELKMISAFVFCFVIIFVCNLLNYVSSS